MKNKLYIPLLSLGMLVATATFAQDDKTQKGEPKKTEQDTTKKSGTRMAINSQGLPTKGGTKANNSSNKTAGDPKKDETTPKKEGPK
ncbi:MAG TPA: hypothetical protein VGF30_15540 [Bacteroidia bacterium]